MTNITTLSAAEKLDWLRLIRCENVGPITFHRLLERFGSAHAALQALPEMAQRGGRAKAIKICSKAVAEQEMAALAKLGASLVASIEPQYPPLLAHIEDAPPLISVRGNLHLLQGSAIAVVGARNASCNGMRFARKIAENLGRNGLFVASGLARGIDTSAHEGSLTSGTIAVVAGGVDVIYPRKNANLYERIVEQGVLISECAPGEVPQARHFPRRNRIISGVSRSVVVIEAARRSGSLITARMALEQGREVFAVPGSPMDPRSAGANDLIHQGANITQSAEDILNVLDDLLHTPLGEPEPIEIIGHIPSLPTEYELNKARIDIEKSLGPEPVMVDEIIRKCQMSPAMVCMVLLELELAGRLERHCGNQVSLVWT